MSPRKGPYLPAALRASWGDGWWGGALSSGGGFRAHFQMPAYPVCYSNLPSPHQPQYPIPSPGSTSFPHSIYHLLTCCINHLFLMFTVYFLSPQ